MSQIESLSELGLGFCEICDNYTPVVKCLYCSEEQCEICLEVYGCMF